LAGRGLSSINAITPISVPARAVSNTVRADEKMTGFIELEFGDSVKETRELEP